MNTYIHTRPTYKGTYFYMHICIDAYMHVVHTKVHTYTCIHTRPTYKGTYLYINTYIYTYTPYIQKYIFTYIHTRIQIGTEKEKEKEKEEEEKGSYIHTCMHTDIVHSNIYLQIYA